jgi:hypothetical protein
MFPWNYEEEYMARLGTLKIHRLKTYWKIESLLIGRFKMSVFEFPAAYGGERAYVEYGRKLLMLVKRPLFSLRLLSIPGPGSSNIVSNNNNNFVTV